MATPGTSILECHFDPLAEGKRRIRIAEQPADHPQVRLIVELDIDQHERQLEPLQERMAHHRPGPHFAAARDRLVTVGRLGALAMRADDVWRQGESMALPAARQLQFMRGAGRPERRGCLVRNGQDSAGHRSLPCRRLDAPSQVCRFVDRIAIGTYLAGIADDLHHDSRSLQRPRQRIVRRAARREHQRGAGDRLLGPVLANRYRAGGETFTSSTSCSARQTGRAAQRNKQPVREPI